MLRKLYTLCFIVSPLFALAQPTVDSLDANIIGSTNVFRECSSTVPTKVVPGVSGGPVSWTFATLSGKTGTHADTVTETTKAFNNVIFPGANVLDSFSDGSKYFDKESAATTFHVAYCDGSVGDTLRYTSNERYAVRPMTYGTHPLLSVDTISAKTSTATVTGYATIDLDADAYGVLTVPNGVVYQSTLRVHTTTVETDQAPPAGNITHYTNTYSWYDAHHSAAVMRIEIDSTPVIGSTTLVRYLIRETPFLAHIENVNSAKLSFTASLNNNNLVLAGNFAQGTNYGVSVLNMAGQKVFSSEFAGNGTGVQLNVSSQLSAGIYMVALFDKNNPSNFSVTKVLKD